MITGSFNWSPSAAHTNDETLLVIDSPKLAKHSPVRWIASGTLLNWGSLRTFNENWIVDGSAAGMEWRRTEKVERRSGWL